MKKSTSPIAVLFFLLSVSFFVAPIFGCSKNGEEQATSDIKIAPPKEIGENSAVVTWTTVRPVPVTLEVRRVHGVDRQSVFIDGGHGTRGIVTLPNLEPGKYYEVRAVSLERIEGEGHLQPTSEFWSFFTSEVGKANGWSGMDTSVAKAFAGAGY
jgi:hypothetical protein